MNKNLKKHSKNNVDDIKHTLEPSFLSVVKENINISPITIPESEFDLPRQYTADAAYLAPLNTLGEFRLKQYAKTNIQHKEVDTNSNDVKYSIDPGGASILITNYFTKGIKVPDKFHKVLAYISAEMFRLCQSKWKKGITSGDDSALRFTIRKFVDAMSLNPNNTASSRRHFAGVLINTLKFLSRLKIDMVKRRNYKLEANKNNYIYWRRFNIIDEAAVEDRSTVVENGMATIKFAEGFIKYFLENHSAMQFPEIATKVSNLAVQLLNKIYTQRKRSSKAKDNVFTMVKHIKLRVEILIRSAGDIPLYETLKYKKLKERIIEPFERAMNEIKETKGIGISSWEYCGRLGKKVHVNDFKKKYEDYKSLYVIIEFDDNAQHTQAHKTMEAM
jgi:hypothetical protein